MNRLLSALLFLTPSIAVAQFGASVGLRSANGEETDAANSQRRGFELRVHYDGAFTPTWGWRAEVSGVQMQYQRDIPGLDRRVVSENGFEVAALGRGLIRNGALSGLYGVAGPVGSHRANCGRSGGFTNCSETPGQQLGYVLGVGFATAASQRRDWVFEVRYSDRVVSGAGASLLTLGVGVRGRRPQAGSR